MFVSLCMLVTCIFVLLSREEAQVVLTFLTKTSHPHSDRDCQVPSVSCEEPILSRPVHCTLSRLRCQGHSLLLSSSLRRINLSDTSSCSSCGHHIQDLHHLQFDCPASESLWRAVFGTSLSLLDLLSRPWGGCCSTARPPWSFVHAPRRRTGTSSTNHESSLA